MNDSKIVEIECFNEKKNQQWVTVGRLQEGVHHVALISGWTEGIDLCTYTIIPKVFIRRVRQLKLK